MPFFQVKVRVSMSFTPQQVTSATACVDYELLVQRYSVNSWVFIWLFYLSKGQENVDQPCTFPEVFLTLGAPGDNLVIPLSPVPGRSLFLNLNLVPKDDANSRQGSPSPKKVSSKAPSPNATLTDNAETSCPHNQRKPLTSPISPDEDYFSLIQRVHTAQLQKALGQVGKKWKGGCGKGRDKTKQGKGKWGGKKDRKDGGNKQ